MVVVENLVLAERGIRSVAQSSRHIRCEGWHLNTQRSTIGAIVPEGDVRRLLPKSLVDECSEVVVRSRWNKKCMRGQCVL